MKKSVLFICTGNSARSQMSEGFLRAMAGEYFEVFSAGTKPGVLNPYAVKAMKESGVDISGQVSKSLDLFLDREFDYVITVCGNAKQTCPVFPGKAKRMHWDLDDPAEAQGAEENILNVFRDSRDRIRELTEGFIQKEAPKK